MRRLHQLGSYGVLLLGIVHTALTPVSYPGLSAETLWFAGTGVMLIALALLNMSIRHAPIRSLVFGSIIVNAAAFVLAVLAASVIRQPQALLLVLFLGSCLAGSAQLVRLPVQE
jgi:hypothetical protein